MEGIIKIVRVLMLSLGPLLGWSQEAVHNYGTIKIHDSGLVGFHMDVINDGPFNENKGLVGFYKEDGKLVLSGSSDPVFYDMEVSVDNGLYLERSLGISNNLNFISGNIITPVVRSETNISFLKEAFYVGEGVSNHIVGYASTQGHENITFPIGDGMRFRPLTLTSVAKNDYAKSAYFYEDPNSPSIFGESFTTVKTQTEFLSVSTYEYWHLKGEQASFVELTWDEDSNIAVLVDDLEELRVVGWNIANKQWEDLGNSMVNGNLSEGKIASNTFVPDDYRIITLGGNKGMLQSLSASGIELDNYYMTPNGDGINDRLIIDGIENSPNNALQIYNRYGVLVYSKSNYSNEFDGTSNREITIARNSGLPSGIYFYVVRLNDLNQTHQGYLYLTSYN